jgi:hypothetical protein
MVLLVPKVAPDFGLPAQKIVAHSGYATYSPDFDLSA